MDPFDRMVQAMSAGPPVRSDGRPVVLFHTHWRNPDDGWDIASRAYARAMLQHGVDVKLLSWRAIQGPLDPVVAAEVGDMAKPTYDWDVHIFSGALGAPDHVVAMINNMIQEPGVQALHCIFERQQVDARVGKKLNELSGVWANCTANYEALRAAGATNAVLIRLPYFDNNPLLRMPAPSTSNRYYWIGRFEPRKAGDNLVRAFMLAFRPEEATLTIKLSPYGIGESTPEKIVLEMLNKKTPGWSFANWRSSIKILRGRLTAEEIRQLHAENDVYVSASRGEGLDMPAFDAKLAGRRLVLADSGGPRDFVCGSDILVPATGSIPAHPDYEWGEGATYADYSLDELVAAMQQARKSPGDGSRPPAHHRAEYVGRQFYEWISSLL